VIIHGNSIGWAGENAFSTTITAGWLDKRWFLWLHLDNGTRPTDQTRLAGLALLADFPIDYRQDHSVSKDDRSNYLSAITRS